MDNVTVRNISELYTTPWDLLLTIRTQDLPPEDAYRHLKKNILLPLADLGRTQIGAVTVTVPYQQEIGKLPHAHVLLIGKQTDNLLELVKQFRQRLIDRKGPYSGPRDILYKPVFDIPGAISYLTGPHNLVDGALLRYHNRKFIIKRSFK